MANEITITISAVLANGSVKRTWAPGADQINQTAAVRHASTVALTTAVSQLSVGSVTTLGYIMMINPHATVNVIWGPHSGGALVGLGTLKPGESNILRLTAGTTVAARMDSGTGSLDYELWSD